MRRFTISDTRHEAGNARPRGIYLGPTVVHDGLEWQVDIWIVAADEAAKRRDLVRSISAKLDDETRRRILEIKQVAAASDRYHRGVSSVDIYTAVLDRGVADIAGFTAYLAETGRSL